MKACGAVLLLALAASTLAFALGTTGADPFGESLLGNDGGESLLGNDSPASSGAVDILSSPTHDLLSEDQDSDTTLDGHDDFDNFMSEDEFQTFGDESESNPSDLAAAVADNSSESGDVHLHLPDFDWDEANAVDQENAAEVARAEAMVEEVDAPDAEEAALNADLDETLDNPFHGLAAFTDDAAVLEEETTPENILQQLHIIHDDAARHLHKGMDLAEEAANSVGVDTDLEYNAREVVKVARTMFAKTKLKAKKGMDMIKKLTGGKVNGQLDKVAGSMLNKLDGIKNGAEKFLKGLQGLIGDSNSKANQQQKHDGAEAENSMAKESAAEANAVMNDMNNVKTEVDKAIGNPPAPAPKPVTPQLVPVPAAPAPDGMVPHLQHDPKWAVEVDKKIQKKLNPDFREKKKKKPQMTKSQKALLKGYNSAEKLLGKTKIHIKKQKTKDQIAMEKAVAKANGITKKAKSQTHMLKKEARSSAAKLPSQGQAKRTMFGKKRTSGRGLTVSGGARTSSGNKRRGQNKNARSYSSGQGLTTGPVNKHGRSKQSDAKKTRTKGNKKTRTKGNKKTRNKSAQTAQARAALRKTKQAAAKSGGKALRAAEAKAKSAKNKARVAAMKAREAETFGGERAQKAAEAARVARTQAEAAQAQASAAQAGVRAQAARVGADQVAQLRGAGARKTVANAAAPAAQAAMARAEEAKKAARKAGEEAKKARGGPNASKAAAAAKRAMDKAAQAAKAAKRVSKNIARGQQGKGKKMNKLGFHLSHYKGIPEWPRPAALAKFENRRMKQHRKDLKLVKHHLKLERMAKTRRESRLKRTPWVTESAGDVPRNSTETNKAEFGEEAGAVDKETVANSDDDPLLPATKDHAPHFDNNEEDGRPRSRKGSDPEE